MNLNKILLGGVVGGVIYFLLGWLFYGMLMADYYAANTNQCMMKPMADMNMLAMILSNLAGGFLLAFIIDWAKAADMMAGAKVAGIAALLMCLSFDLSFYSMSTMFSNITILIVDVAAWTVMSAIAGAIVAMVMNMGTKKEA
ncbi:MAG: hypothetical protein Q7T50_02250 [Candidatus Magasanikbacteria bacterium]|nr:hypothetical protein [Candidatus Magasanikbacteria bacterium]